MLAPYPGYVPYTEGMTEDENDIRILRNIVAHRSEELRIREEHLKSLWEAIANCEKDIKWDEIRLELAHQELQEALAHHGIDES